MLFNSLDFVFFLLMLLIAQLTVGKSKNSFSLFLLLASYTFYGYWNYWYLVLIIGSTLIDYNISSCLMRTNDKNKRKLLVLISVLLNLSMLGFFKYYSFAYSTLSTFLNLDFLPPNHGFVLPVGISFYTFQTISYTVDVYKNKYRHEEGIIKFALFVCYFPQLIAGPIEKAQDLMPQLDKLNRNFRDKLNLLINNFHIFSCYFITGLFKKVVVADNLLPYLESVNKYKPDQEGILYLVNSLFSAFKVYYDASGYCDMAIGVSILFGIKLSENFNNPFFATSISDYWRRWHITISRFFRDYVYISLGGNRVSSSRFIVNIICTFLLSGLWHGPSWNFVIWGLCHGVFISLENTILKPFAIKSDFWALNFLRWMRTIYIILCIRCFYTSYTFSEGIFYLKKLNLSIWYLINNGVTLPNYNNYDLWSHFKYSISLPETEFDHTISILFLLLCFESLAFLLRKTTVAEAISRTNSFNRGLYLSVVTILILWFGVMDSNQFVYFSF